MITEIKTKLNMTLVKNKDVQEKERDISFGYLSFLYVDSC